MTLPQVQAYLSGRFEAPFRVWAMDHARTAYWLAEGIIAGRTLRIQLPPNPSADHLALAASHAAVAHADLSPRNRIYQPAPKRALADKLLAEDES